MWITHGRPGFPPGEWTTLMYKPMAERVAAELRTHGVKVKVRLTHTAV